MKKKLLFITTLLLLQGEILFSQCISVELSVTWKMGYDIFNKDSIVSIPILNITYRNNCDTNYYFFKVSPRSDGMAMTTCIMPPYYSEDNNDNYKRAKNHHKYTNQNFNIIMGGLFSYRAGWMIFTDTIDYSSRFSTEYINCSLQDIYDYVYSIGFRDYKRPGYFVSSDITSENIISGYFIKDHFVFLESGKTHIDTYNLIGFKLVEGCFTFIIDQKEIENYIITGFGFDEQKIELPTVVGEYHRYSGAFNTNKVTVCFGDK
jgi:hypothetical protein